MEAKRKADEDAARMKAEAERLAAEVEAKRKADEEAARKKVEEERLAAEAEAKRVQKAQEVAARLAAEAEEKRKADADAAAARKAADSLAAEAAAKRKVEQEAARLKAEQERPADKPVASAPQADTTPPAAVATSPPEASAQAEPEQVRAARVAEVEACAKELAALQTSRMLRFKLNSTDLRRSHTVLLDAIAELAKRCQAVTFIVGGHTDATGTEAENDLLSEERAEAVRAALVERGVDAKRLEKRAFGARQPADGIFTRFAKLRNRRVEITAMEYRPATGAP